MILGTGVILSAQDPGLNPVAVLGDTVATIVNIKFLSNSFCNLAFMSPGLRNAAGVYHSRPDKRAMYILPRDKVTSWGRM